MPTESPETPANVLCCGDAGKPRSDASTSFEDRQAEVSAHTAPLKTPTIKPSGAAAIPTLDADSLLASVRGRWRHPPTLQRKDFEAVFRQQARAVVPLDEVLAQLRAGSFNTQADFAKYYGKAPSWTRSLMWCCLRDGLVADVKTWKAYFPKKRRTTPKREPPVPM